MNHEEQDAAKELANVEENWEGLARKDAFGAILMGQQWTEEAFMSTGEKRIRELSEFAQRCRCVLEGQSALDFGCGVGRLTNALAQRFQRVIGIDISAEMIDKARTLARKQNITFLVNRTDKLPFPDNSFDAVVTQLVLQHMPADLQLHYIAEMMRVIRIGGIVIFDTFEKALQGEEKTLTFDVQGYEVLMVCVAPEQVQRLIINSGGLIRGIHCYETKRLAGRMYCIEKGSELMR
jgi:ubiquinone/menaquinone biosynthesis C-methylase UbiE